MENLTIEDYRKAKKELNEKIITAIKEFKVATGVYPSKIEYQPLLENTKSGQIFLGHDLHTRIDLF